MLRLLIVVACLCFATLSESSAGEPATQPQPCVGGSCGVQPVVIQQRCFGGQCVPQTIYQPTTTYTPLQYQGSTITERRYRTPIRTGLFGRWRIFHTYRAQ